MKTAAGAVRAKRACGELDALNADLKKAPPAPPKAAVDAAIWKDAEESIVSALGYLAESCKANDLTQADQRIAYVNERTAIRNAMAIPRLLPPPLRDFDTQLRQTWALDLGTRHKRLCQDSKALRTHFDAIPEDAPPANVAADKWSEVRGTIKEQLDFMVSTCKTPTKKRDSDGGSSDKDLQQLHEAFYKTLVLLFPANSK